MYRTAFSAEKILTDYGQHLTFAYRDNTGQRQTATLTPEAFLDRFLQHVLPRDLQRVQYFGWLSPAAKTRFERIAALLDWTAPALEPTPPRPARECPYCHQPMMHLRWLPRAPPFDTS